MANKKSAEKRARQSVKRRARNRSGESTMRTAVKRLRQLVETGDAKAAAELLPTTLGTVDRTARKKIIHTNAADRTKARLTRAVNALQK
jgi:small subunit ribosomal protein S20